VRHALKNTESRHRSGSSSTEINRAPAKMDSAILPTSNGDFARAPRRKSRSPRTKSEKPTGLTHSLSFSLGGSSGERTKRGKKEDAEINRATKRCSSIARRSLSQPSCVNPARRSRLVPLPRKTTHERLSTGCAEERPQVRKRSWRIVEPSLDKKRRDRS
jgi:hypothetical protein